MTVTVIAEAGTVDIIPQGWVEPQTPAQAAALEVAGAVVSLPAGVNADDHPYAVVLDPDAAQDWLGSVYGRQVAQACRGLRHGQTRQVAAEVGDTTRALTDLARACWVERWWPSAIAGLPGADQAALDLDRGLLAARAGRCLDALQQPACPGLTRRRSTWTGVCSPPAPGAAWTPCSLGGRGWAGGWAGFIGWPWERPASKGRPGIGPTT